MQAGAFLEAAAALPVARIDALAGARGLLVVAPHPDDESLGCGATIAAAIDAGRAVRIVVLSDGIGSHPNSLAYPPERLRRLRETETLAAAAALGLAPDAVSFLRLPDREVPSAGPEAERAATAIAEAARATDAGAILVTWRHDPHCDHAAAYAIVRLAAPRLPGVAIHEYSVWGWALPANREVGPAPAGLRIATTAHAERKRQAVGAHRSQLSDLIDDDPGGFRLDDATLDRLLGPYEIFLRAEPDR